MTIHDRLTHLLRKVASQSATAADLQELSDLVREDPSGELSEQIAQLLQAEQSPQQVSPYNKDRWNEVADAILAADRPQPARVVPFRKWAWAAAVAVLILSGAGYWLLQKTSLVQAPIVAAQPVKDIAPGGNKAVLTLADGTEIVLDSAGNGILARQGNTRVIKSGNGQLQYQSPGADKQALYNKISTPRGGQFQVTLPDGSQVWLNASSSLRYPAAFTGAVRKVELTGEAYFEIAKNAGKPFLVQVEEMEVEVLGTHFNIMAYEDEEVVKTTLLEGAVKVKRHGTAGKLLPGQGASLNRQSGVLEFLKEVNTEEAVAWKNGFIQFEGNDIRSAMRQIARWYDVEVVYKGNVPAHFRGIIPRNVPVSRVLKMMELTGEVHFEIGQKQIIVSP